MNGLIAAVYHWNGFLAMSGVALLVLAPCLISAVAFAALTFDGEAEVFSDYLALKNYPWWHNLQKDIHQSREQFDRDTDRARDFVARNSPWVLATVAGTVGLILTALLMPPLGGSDTEDQDALKQRVLAMRQQEDLNTQSKKFHATAKTPSDRSIPMEVEGNGQTLVATPAQPLMQQPPEPIIEQPEPDLPPEEPVVYEPPQRERIFETFRSDRNLEMPLRVVDDEREFAVVGLAMPRNHISLAPEMIDIDFRQQALRREMELMAESDDWKRSVIDRVTTSGAVARGNGDLLPNLSGQIDTTVAGLRVVKSFPRHMPTTGIVGYRILLQNSLETPLEKIVIEEELGRATVLDAVDPPADSSEDNTLTWRIASIPPLETREIRVDLFPGAVGEIQTRTRIRHFAAEAVAVTNVRDRQPIPVDKKRTSLRIDIDGPETSTVGKMTDFVVDLENTGDTVIDGAGIRVLIDDRVYHPRGTTLFHRVKTDLAPGQDYRAKFRLRTERAGRSKVKLELLREDKVLKTYDRVINISPARKTEETAQRPLKLEDCDIIL